MALARQGRFSCTREHTLHTVAQEQCLRWLQVLRIFGFTTAGAPEITCCRSKRKAIQPAPFKYDEDALRYYDFFMAECARVILNPAN